MAKKAKINYGHLAFLIGVLLAIVAAFIAIPQIVLILFVLGLVIGIANITAKEGSAFLIATVALIVAGSAAGGFAAVPGIGNYIADILINIVILVAPAAVLIALKEIKMIAKD
jgi:hypothetical protein